MLGTLPLSRRLLFIYEFDSVSFRDTIQAILRWPESYVPDGTRSERSRLEHDTAHPKALRTLDKRISEPDRNAPYHGFTLT